MKKNIIVVFLTVALVVLTLVGCMSTNNATSVELYADGNNIVIEAGTNNSLKLASNGFSYEMPKELEDYQVYHFEWIDLTVYQVGQIYLVSNFEGKICYGFTHMQNATLLGISDRYMLFMTSRGEVVKEIQSVRKAEYEATELLVKELDVELQTAFEYVVESSKYLA